MSVVIPHYGDPAHALALIDALRHQQGEVDTQILVVDDASPTPFPNDDDQTTVIRRDRNGGFGAAVNTGAREAQHPLLLILNSDLGVGTTFVRDLVDAADAWMPAVLGPHLLDAVGTPQWAGRHFPRARHYVIEWLTPLARWRPRLHEAVGHDTRCVAGVTAPVDWVVGAAMLVPTSDFRAVGGFDESFHMNCEEVDLQRRLRERGVPSVFVGHIVAVHTGGGSSHIDRRRTWVLASRLRYARKWRERPLMLRGALSAASTVNFGANALRRLRNHRVRPIATYRAELALLSAAAKAAR